MKKFLNIPKYSYFLIAIIFLLNISDLIFTLYGLKYWGTEELNPVMNYLLEKGNLYIILIKISITLFVCLIFAYGYSKSNEPRLYRILNFSSFTIITFYVIINAIHINNLIYVFLYPLK